MSQLLTSLLDLLKPYLAALVGFIEGFRTASRERKLEDAEARYTALKTRQDVEREVHGMSGAARRDELRDKWTRD